MIQEGEGVINTIHHILIQGCGGECVCLLLLMTVYNDDNYTYFFVSTLGFAIRGL